MRRTTALVAAAVLCVAIAPMSPAAAESKSVTVPFGPIGALDDSGVPATTTEDLDSGELPGEGEGFRIRDVRALVQDVSHTNPSDIDLGLFVGPAYSTMLMSDAGGDDSMADPDIVNSDFLFDDNVSNVAPSDHITPLVGGKYVTSDYDDDLDSIENDGDDGLAFFNLADLDGLDSAPPDLLRGTWQFFARDDALNGETGSIGLASVLIRMDRPDVNTLVATQNPAQQNAPVNVTATATAFGPNCGIPTDAYLFDLNGDGDFDDDNEGAGPNTRALDTSTAGARDIRVRVYHGDSGGYCPAVTAFRDRSIHFVVEEAAEGDDVDAEPATCGGQIATHQGTDAGETIVGTAGDDVIAGLGGGDVIRGLGGNDIICGGDGTDLVKGNSGADKLYGDAGSDDLRGGKGRDACAGGLGFDRARKCEKVGSL